MTQSFQGLSGKEAKCSLETDAAAGSTSLELQTPWPQGLRANLFPQKNFDVYIKNMVLWTPGEIKGPNTNCLKRLVCVERQELCQDWNRHDSKLDSTWLQTPSIVSENWYPISLACDPSWDGMLSILNNVRKLYHLKNDPIPYKNYLYIMSLLGFCQLIYI